MLHDLDAVAAVFADTKLAGIEPRTEPLDRSPHDRINLALTTEQIDPFDAWTIARSKLDVTGRWPVILSPFEEGPDRGDETTGAAILERAEALDERAVFAAFERLVQHRYGLGRRREATLRRIEVEVEMTRRRAGIAPTTEEARKAIGDAGSETELDIWLAGWEWNNGAWSVENLETPDQEYWDFLLRPPVLSGGRYSLALLPVADSWQIPSLLHFYDFDKLELPNPSDEEDWLYVIGRPESLAISLRSWHRRYGLDVWGFQGTKLNCLAKQRPTSVAEALALVREFESFFGHGMGAIGGGSHREHAHRLFATNHWALYSKP